MKKVCIKGNEFNTNYHEVFGEEKAKADGYSVFEVAEGYEDCAFEDFDENGFNVALYNERKTKQNAIIEIMRLKDILNKNDYKGQKYLDGEYTEEEWAEIVAQRKEWRNQIRQLEKELNGGEE